MAQYNFFIEDELKDKVEKALADSGISLKPKFLEDMVNVYQIHLASISDIEIDMTAYQNTNKQSKEAIQKAFTHILTTLDYNFSTFQQDKIYVEKQKQELNNKSEAVAAEVEKLKLTAHEELKELTSKYELEKTILMEKNKKIVQENKEIEKLLEKSQKELVSMSSIAKETTSVMEENRELRTDRAELQKKHSLEVQKVEEQNNIKIDLLRTSYDELQKSMNLKDKELFEATHTLVRCKEDLEQYREEQKQKQVESNNKQKELEDIKSKYNQLLGKIEVLERLEKEHNEVDD